MKTITILIVTLIIAGPAFAGAIRPSQAQGAQGQYVIVEGTAHVEQGDPGAATKVELSDNSDNHLTVMVPAAIESSLSQLNSYEGKTVDVTGVVQITPTGPQIVLSRANQIKLASP